MTLPTPLEQKVTSLLVLRTLLIIWLALTTVILLSGRWHWERYEMDGVTFGLGYVKWETGKFPNYRGFIIQYEENIK